MLRSILTPVAVSVYLLTLCWASVQAEATENIVVNGDFSDGLSSWTCVNLSTQCSYCPDAWSECYVDDGQAVIHGHSAYGKGMLRQEFSEVSATYFSFSWNLDGDCSSVRVDLLSGEDVALHFFTKNDAWFPYPSPSTSGSFTEVCVGDTYERIEMPPNYLDHGDCHVVFDYTNLEVTFIVDAKAQGLHICTLPMPTHFSVNAVELGVYNSCCDGRNDVYGFFNDVVLIPEPPIEAAIDIAPDTLDLSSRGKWVTCYIELPEGFDVIDIDGETVTLYDIPAHIGEEGWARAGASSSNILDHDGDGVPERMVKFDRSAVQSIVELGKATLTVSGELIDETRFEGIDVIRVIDEGKNKE